MNKLLTPITKHTTDRVELRTREEEENTTKNSDLGWRLFSEYILTGTNYLGIVLCFVLNVLVHVSSLFNNWVLVMWLVV